MSDTGANASADWQPVTAVFAAHARRAPDAVAVDAGDARRTYAEMAERVDLFAARLSAALGDGDRLVGLCLERDVDLPAWLMAVLKVGGAYLPLDPALPPVRLRQVLEDASPTVIVASRRYAPLLSNEGVPLLIAEDDANAPPAPAVTIRPDTLAYVIFTSGSTGRPKGVEIEHGSLAALLATMTTRPGFAAGERMLGLTRVSFDLSVPDMFLPFFVGGSLALVDLDVAADPERLAGAFEDFRPHLAQATPSTWRALVEGGWRGSSDLRIVAGGEAVTRALADRLLSCCGELWNIYGPTETTVWSTAYRVEPGDGPIPIGWPLDMVNVRVTDAALEELPAGEVGEIVIGGVGVARGYRNRPDLTAERFVRLPGEVRAYRTGDLGRFDEAGVLFCLGRLDDQVKVRGFRVELGDVEAALALHPDVAWCAVKLWTDPSGEPVLVGYVVPRAAAPPARAIKAFLATHLAAYMIPDRIVTVAVMPLTPNGKVDRASLPDPFATADAHAAASDRAPVETRLAAIWCGLLGVPAVTADDDFFELGGYSLMTVRLARTIESEFGVKLALIELLQHSQLSAMAARIARGGGGSASAAMLLNAGGERAPLFWLDAGPLMRTMARGLSGDQPAYALNMDAADEEAFGDAVPPIAAVAARLRARLRAVQPTGPYYLGGWCRWGIVAFELAHQLEAQGETVALLILLDAERPRSTLRSRVRRWLRRERPSSLPEPSSFSQRVEFATRSYAPQRYAGDVLLLRPEASRNDGGWGAVIQNSLRVTFTPGDHLSMVRAPHVQVLAAVVDHALCRAQKRFPAAKADAVAPPRAVSLT